MFFVFRKLSGRASGKIFQSLSSKEEKVKLLHDLPMAAFNLVDPIGKSFCLAVL